MHMTSQIFVKNYEKKSPISSQKSAFNIQIISIFSQLTKKDQIMASLLNKIETDLKNKRSNNDEEEHEVQPGDFGEPKKKKKKDKHFLRTTLNAMHDNYLKYNSTERKPGADKNIEVLKFTKKKMMASILGYTNNLVYDDMIK